MLFLLATFLAPLVAIVPYEAATPALVVVGFLMMVQVKGIDWDDVEVAIPAFLTIVLMPFTYSITVGIGAGFVSYVLIKAVRGKAAQVHPLLWLVAALFVLYFALDPIAAAPRGELADSGSTRGRAASARSAARPRAAEVPALAVVDPERRAGWPRPPRSRRPRRRPWRRSRARTRPASGPACAAPGRR